MLDILEVEANTYYAQYQRLLADSRTQASPLDSQSTDRESNSATQVEADTTLDEDIDQDSYFKRYTLQDAGTPIQSVAQLPYPQSTTLLIEHPFHPFANAEEFNLARWFIENQISDHAVNSWPQFKFTPQASFTSAKKLKALAQQLDGTLGWDS